MIRLFSGWRVKLRKIVDIGKCQSCGDKAELYLYNKAKTCAICLGRDVRGVTRLSILKKNTGKKDELRRPRKGSW